MYIHLPSHALMNDIAYLWYVHLVFISSVLFWKKSWIIYEHEKRRKISVYDFFSTPHIPTTYVPTLNLKFKTWGRLDYTFPCFNKKNMKKSWFLHKIIFVCVSSGNWFDHNSCIIFSLLNTCIIVFER